MPARVTSCALVPTPRVGTRTTFLPLHSFEVLAIVPPHLRTEQTKPKAENVVPVLKIWVRGVLVAIVVGLVAVFMVAARLNPYDAAGRPLRMASHRQLGLPPCTFYSVTGGIPCPSCGMTTSFALLMHGDLWGSLQANAVGTLLALFCLTLIPWGLVCGVWGRSYFIASLERALTVIVLVFIVLMLLRWAIVLVLLWASGNS